MRCQQRNLGLGMVHPPTLRSRLAVESLPLPAPSPLWFPRVADSGQLGKVMKSSPRRRSARKQPWMPGSLRDSKLRSGNSARGSVMKLTAEQSQKIFQEHGVWVTEACDKCGSILGPIRYTRRAEPGEWCSRECRDGNQAITPGRCCGCGASLQVKRRSAKWCSDTCRDRANRSVLDSSNKGGTPAHSKRLTGGGIGFGCPYTKRAEIGHLATGRI